MTVLNDDPVEVPPVIPDGPNEDARGELLRRAIETAAGEGSEIPEFEDPDWSEELPESKPVRRKLLTAFAGLLVLFILLAAGLSWFFGIGSFSAQKTRSIDRTRSSSAPATEDEKLKAALSLVADKNPVPETGTPAGMPGNNSSAPPTLVTVPADGRDMNREDVFSPGSPAMSDPAIRTEGLPANTDSPGSPSGTRGEAGLPDTSRQRAPAGESDGTASRELMAPGRSLFFGIEKKEVPQVAKAATTGPVTVIEREAGGGPGPLPFGTLLPVRLTGAVFTLRNSSGMVRMELTRAVSGKGYAYPAGTQLVGTVRGGEYKRAFISVAGLIDPGTGQLVKFNGEVLGNDGASGMPGRRRSITGAWSRALAGLRDTGRSVISAIGSARSGGTIVIGDQARSTSAALSEQAAGLVGGKQGSDEFVELAAGTTGYVLATGLPESRTVGRSGTPARIPAPDDNGPSISGLTDQELAELFTDGSPEKLRAAIPRMTPEFRRLAAVILSGTADGSK